MSVAPEPGLTDGKKRVPKPKPKAAHSEASVVATHAEVTNGGSIVDVQSETHATAPAIVNSDGHSPEHIEVEVTAETTETETQVTKPKGTRQRLHRYADDQIITVLKPDAKSGAASIRYNVYKTGMTVKEYVDIMTSDPYDRSVGEVWNDIRWDTDEKRQLIHIGPEVVDVPPPPPPKVAKPRKKKAAEATTEEHQAEQPVVA
jgi:hypothetical protein